jgi:hypothetical protein
MNRSSLFLLIAMLVAPFAGRAENAATAAPAPAPAPAAQPPAAPTGVLVADLRGEATPAYPYGSWVDAVKRSADGVVIVGAKGAQGDGGICGNMTTPVDLSGMTYVEVALAVGQTNEVPEVTVAVGDADETLASARVRIEQIVPGQPVWFRVPVHAFVLGSGKYAGKVTGLDWTKIAQWHVQGDWSTKKPLQVLVIAIRARR